MSKPNRVLAHLPKNPFECVAQFYSTGMADARAAVEKQKGFDVKITTARVGAKKNSKPVWRVWVREFPK